MTLADPSRSRILLTGFGAFPGVPANATSQLVPVLAAEAMCRYPECDFQWDILPVTWQGGPLASARLIETFDPHIVVHFGVSEGASGFVIETLARNCCRAAPDAGGALPALDLLDAYAPAGLQATLPCQTIVARLLDAGFPAELSEDAGAYLCNAVLFQTLMTVRPGVQAGFVHLPVRLDGIDAPISMEAALRGGLAVLAACLEPGNRG
ncbi:MAG: pyroglutamyl-peptidase I [Alphaproteobacteria bacterium]|nr:pyroglutamyl-peptidase I [Alphaproteobacteria bacterium]